MSVQVLEPATRLVEVARQSVAAVEDAHAAANLQETSQALSTNLAELRVALNHAQQLNFSQQLLYSEELIKELDQELLDIQRAAQAGNLRPVPGETAQEATTQLNSSARQVRPSLFPRVSL